MQEWFHLSLLALKVSILLQVFAIGLGTTWQDATYLFRHPRLLLNSILARNVALPIIAILLIKGFTLRPAVAITLGVLAVTPVPPLLPKSQVKAGARSEYVLGLLVSQTLLAVVLVPVTIEIMDWALGAQAHFSPGQVGMLMLKAVLIPLGVGMLAALLLPKLKQSAHILLTVGNILLLAGAIPLLFLAWKALTTLVGNGTLLALAIFIAAGTAVGHLLGGPKAEDRTTLAIATAARHPGMAIAIAAANFPNQSRTLVAGAVVLYLIMRIFVDLPYMRWRKRSQSDQESRTKPPFPRAA